MKNKKINKVAIIMGSQSDYSTMKYSKKVLQSFNIKSDVKIVSAHRTPKRMFEFANTELQKECLNLLKMPKEIITL